MKKILNVVKLISNKNTNGIVYAEQSKNMEQ